MTSMVTEGVPTLGTRYMTTAQRKLENCVRMTIKTDFFLREIVRGSDNMLNMLKKLKLSIVDKGNVHIQPLQLYNKETSTPNTVGIV